jgi:hypothetical protein
VTVVLKKQVKPMDEFTLWMQSLDPVALAGRESFHSQAHRDMVAGHKRTLLKAKVHEAMWKRTVTDSQREEITRNKFKQVLKKWEANNGKN